MAKPRNRTADLAAFLVIRLVVCVIQMVPPRVAFLLADGIEAQHHLYEATGPSAATATFIDARRAVGFQAPLNFAASDPAMMSELREQRARDLFQGGFRLGDLRRWLRQGINDPMHAFPSGQHVNYPAPAWLAYGDATCYPLPLEEYEANPNIRDLKPGG